MIKKLRLYEFVGGNIVCIANWSSFSSPPVTFRLIFCLILRILKLFILKASMRTS